MNRVVLLALGLLVLACERPKQAAIDTQLLQQLAKTRVKLPNGWSLTPAGRSLPLGDLPLNLVVSPSGKYLAVTNNGQSKQSITLIDAASEKVLADVPIPKSWVGLAFSQEEKTLYASGGNDNRIAVFRIENEGLRADSTISLGRPWPNKISPAGLCVDDSRQRLYVVTKDDRALYEVDLAKRAVARRTELPAEAYTCLLSPNGQELYVSLWGGKKVLVFSPEQGEITGEIETDDHPNDLALSRDGRTLFVANANENSVSIIDVAGRRVLETVQTALYPDAPAGSTPNGLALSPDEKTLYVANADNNCLVVFDVSQPGRSRPRGFIPTGWYPTAVRTMGNRVFVANGKGFTSLPNPKGPQPVVRQTQEKGPNPEANDRSQYIGGLFKGTLSLFETPTEPQLAAFSQLVYQNTPYSKTRETQTDGEPGNPVPSRVGDVSPIKYVFYIIKENRTYDQVFGDVKEGNGDPSLCLFGERITPNQHALAREFVLLDNFYVDAEVSADGHNWSTAAYANDFIEKTWPTSYGGRGGTYDYEGGRPIAYPTKGFIWDYCQRAGLSYRSYGEFGHSGKATVPGLEGHVSPTYRGWDLGYKDVDREKSWEGEFDSLVAAGTVPRFNLLRMGNDHTSGAARGKPTPLAAVADNDLAVGRFVEHLSKSPIWRESVVFVLEDDAQNGPDHVDAHRSPALVVSAYTKRRHVEHTPYSTAGVLRTIELILGLPPMSQYDAAAVPLWRCFQKTPDLSTFTARPANVNLNEVNVAVNRNSRRMEGLNLAREDAIPDVEFNEIVWQTVRGLHSRMPAPRRSAFVRVSGRENAEEEDEDD
jgi:YVTN family beta-propeller protein